MKTPDLSPGTQLAWTDSTGDLVVIKLLEQIDVHGWIDRGDLQFYGLWLACGASGETILWSEKFMKQWEVV